MPIGPGERFERYAIEALIGRGEVYRAFDTRLRRKVAVKVIRADKERADAVARLYREARAAAALTHPNAVAVHDVGEAEGVFYIVMELVAGQPLRAYVGDPRPGTDRKISWLADVARALSAAHRAGIIHRDVKPANVMVSDQGFAKVLDFGLARPLGPINPVSFRTAEGHVLGTLRYMAPEQIAGVDADARSDQYAFGVTAYELLAGTHPGGALIDVQPRRLDEIAAEIPSAVASVIARALARDPAGRFGVMEDIVQELEASNQAARGRPYMTPHSTSAATATASGVMIGGGTMTGHGQGSSIQPTLITKEAPSAIVDRRPLVPRTQPIPQGQATSQPLASASPPTMVSHAASGAAPARIAAPAATPGPIAATVSLASHSASHIPEAAPSSLKTVLIIGGVVLAVAVLGVAAFAGTYLGSQRGGSAPPVAVTTAPPPTAAPVQTSSSEEIVQTVSSPPTSSLSSASVRPKPPTTATTTTKPRLPPGGLGF